MTDFDNPDSLYWSCLMPGIKALGEKHDCEFFMDGFVPAFRKGNTSVQIDMGQIVALSKENRYDEVNVAILYYIKILTREKND